MTRLMSPPSKSQKNSGSFEFKVANLADAEWGRKVHAIVQRSAAAPPLSERDVIDFARTRLSPYKVPKSVEFVDSIPRSEATKLNRSSLVAERDGSLQSQ